MTIHLRPRSGALLQAGIILLAASLASLGIATPASATAGTSPLTSPTDDAAELSTATSTEAGSESCDIIPGVDDPKYNNVCPEWISSFTRDDTDTFQGTLDRTAHSKPWFTRVSPDGGLLLTAGHNVQARSPAMQQQTVLVATNPSTGERVWSRQYTTGVVPQSQAPGYVASVPIAAAFSPDSRSVYVFGWTHHPNDTGDSAQLAFVLNVDAATGDTVWATAVSPLAAEGVNRWIARDIEVDPSGGRVYVTGEVVELSFEPGPAPHRPYVAALDASTGSLLWRTDETDFDYAFGWLLALSPDSKHLYLVEPLLYPVIKNTADTVPRAIRVVSYDTATGGQEWASEEYDYPQPPAGMDRNPQEPPVGLAVSPDGSRLYVSTSHIYWRLPPGADQPVVDHINFLALAWDTTTGEQAWTTEYDWSSQAGCTDGINLAAGAALSVQGSLLYVVGPATIDPEKRGGKCNPNDLKNRTIGLLALGTDTGKEAWSRLYHNAGQVVTTWRYVANDPINDIVIRADNVHVKPGPGPGDEGSQVYVSAQVLTEDGVDMASLGLGFDGLTGRQLWQTRYTVNDQSVIPYTGPSARDSALSPDGKTFYLTATMLRDESPTTDQTIVATAAYPTADAAPLVALTASPSSGAAPLQVTLDASGSHAMTSGTTITRYRFDFGDGSEPTYTTNPVVSHSYTDTGTYTATVTVADSRGAVATDAVSITVHPT